MTGNDDNGTVTGLCTDGPLGPMLWLRDGAALLIESADDLSEFFDVIVNVTGERADTAIVPESITPSGETRNLFFGKDDTQR